MVLMRNQVKHYLSKNNQYQIKYPHTLMISPFPIAIRNATKQQFPNSLGVLCTLHLEDNTKRKMTENGAPQEDQKRYEICK